MSKDRKRERGRYPRLITNRQKIYKISGRYIPLTRRRKDGTKYITKPKPYCSNCKCAVRKVYEINSYYGRKIGIKRYVHVGYRCPKCGHLFSRKIVTQDIEIFDDNGR